MTSRTSAPLGAVHFAALDLTLQVVLPVAVVRQHVTQPGGRPQVERVAHFFHHRRAVGG